MELTLTKAQADLLHRFKISKFGGAGMAPFKAGETVVFHPNSVFESYSRHAPGRLIQMGTFSYVCQIPNGNCDLQFGRYCSVATGLSTLDRHHPLGAVTTNPYFYGPHYKAGNIPNDYVYRGKRAALAGSYGPIKVGHDVWIGAHCTIKAGITIGHGAVIAGGSNVVKDVDPYAIVGGNPAKLIRSRFDAELCARLLALAWWDISPKVLRDLNLLDPEDFCTRLERRQEQGDLTAYKPAKIMITQARTFEVISEGRE